MADIKSGFYVTELMGMGVNGVTGDYSRGAAGFWIENGQLAFPVSEMTVAGNLKDMFARLVAANDLEFRAGADSPDPAHRRPDRRRSITNRGPEPRPFPVIAMTGSPLPMRAQDRARQRRTEADYALMHWPAGLAVIGVVDPTTIRPYCPRGPKAQIVRLAMPGQKAKRIPMINRCLAFFLGCALLSGLVLSGSVAGAAADFNPLRPPDTSSPRELLRNFVTNVDSAYTRMRDLLTSYANSNRLYLNADERREQTEIIPSAKEATCSFDFSGVLPILQTYNPGRAIACS